MIKKKFRELIILLSGLIAYMLSKVICLFPRNNRKWVFGDSFRFVDNPKFLFLETCVNHKEIRAIWIARKKQEVVYIRSLGFESYYRWSINGLYHALTAKVYVFDHRVSDINGFLFGGAFLVNLWHGSSVKKVRWQAPEFYKRKHNLKNEKEMETSFVFMLKEYDALFVRPSLLLAPSVIQAREFFSPMLRVPLKNIIVSVFPRSKFLLEGMESARAFIDKYEPQISSEFVDKLSNYEKSYIYMPTWRGGNVDFVKSSGIDWETLDKELKKKNEILILKLHPFTRMKLSELHRYENICIFPSECDIYTIYPFIDCLITDYSSVYTDFLIMNKEIILFIFDYDKFTKESHTLEDYESYYMGTRAYNFDQLIDIIKSNKDCHIPRDKYDYSMKFFWDNNLYNIDIVEEIKKRLN